MAAKKELTTTEPKKGGRKKQTDLVKIRVSVRNLVEFLLRNGDIDNSKGGRGGEDAMQAGTKIHKKIQKS